MREALTDDWTMFEEDATEELRHGICVSNLAYCVAKQYGVPLYVCAPTSTIDMTLETGEEIPIEERDPEEITEMWYQARMAPESVKVYNPCFDVTDHDLITAIITEKGIARPPYRQAFEKMLQVTP